MRRFTLTVVAFLCLFQLSAQRKSVGLVLSGGGAKGVAHIGAIRVLEQAGIPIDYIVGTSMGAIVGGLYSIGYDVNTLDSLVRTQDWSELFSEKVSRKDMSFDLKESDRKYMINLSLNSRKRLEMPSGIMQGNSVYNFLNRLTIGYHDSISFKKLPIPFACIAYDIVRGKDVVMDSGNLPLSIRASMSIPGAFEPIRTDSMILIDGGISNNFPVDVARKMGAQIIVGVDVGAGMRPKEELNTLLDLFDQITTITGLEAATRNKALTDLYIHPDIVPYTAASFSPEAIDTLINRGQVATMANWDKLIELKEKIGIKDDFMPEEKRTIRDFRNKFLISEIKINSNNQLDDRSEKIIRNSIGINGGDSVTVADITSALNRLQGTGRFARASYQLHGDAPFDLIFMLAPRPINTIGLGLRFDTEGKAAILANATISTKSLYGGMFGITARLSQNPYAKLSYELGGASSHQLRMSYMFLNNNIDLYRNGNKRSNIDFNLNRVEVQLSNIKLNALKASLKIKYDYYDYRSFLAQDAGDSNISSKGYINYSASTKYETLDDLYYPTRGIDFFLNYTLTTDNFITLDEGAPMSAVSFNFRAPIALGGRTAFIPSIYGRTLFGENKAFPYINFMGGVESGRYFDQQLPFIGMNHVELFDNTLLVMRLDFRVRLWVKHYASLIGNYARESRNVSGLFDRGENVWGGGVKYTFSTPVGPLDLLLGSSTQQKGLGVYFNFGYFF